MIQLISDLHLDLQLHRRGHLQSAIDCITQLEPGGLLIIAGDTCHFRNRTESQIQDFFTMCSGKFDRIIEIPGNHDYYQEKFARDNGMFGSFRFMIRSNYEYTNNTVQIYDGYKIICSCLWSEITKKQNKDVQLHLNDYYLIPNFTIEESTLLHRESVSFIKSVLGETDDNSKTIVVTHHLPSHDLVGPKYKGSPISSAFSSDLNHIIKKYAPKYWLHGHSHSPIDTTLYNTRCIRQPFGYVEANGQRETTYNNIILS